jgi:hypothetical protein
MTMQFLIFLFAICFSVSAIAQDAKPKVGTKPLVQVKPKGPQGCKLVGTVKGTKLWAGDCIASEPSRSVSETAPPLATQAVGAIPPGTKQ